MTRLFHAEDPSARIEHTFRRIQTERMSDMPILNPALVVAAVGFTRHDGGEYGKEWRGILLTPWSIGLMLLPASPSWPPAAEHVRVFRRFASGNFVFLGNNEEGIGDYLFCPLIHDMQPFADQESALLTARACLITLDMPPASVAPAAPAVSGSRRKFMAFGA